MPLRLVFFLKNPLHLVFGLNKPFSINFWVKICLYYLPVPGWWNGVIMCKGKLWLDGYYREFVPFLYFQSLMQYNCPSCLYCVFMTLHLNCVFICDYLHLCAYYVNIDSHADLWTLKLWTINCVIPHFHIADDYWCNKAVWTILKVAFLVFVPVVAANEFAKNRIVQTTYYSLTLAKVNDWLILRDGMT